MRYIPEGYVLGRCDACGFGPKPIAKVECYFPMTNGKEPKICLDCKHHVSQIDRLAANVMGIKMDAKLIGVPIVEGYTTRRGAAPDSFDEPHSDDFEREDVKV